MNSFWKTLLLGSLSLGLLPAQQTYRQYVASETIALSGAAASLTVQAADPAVEANHASILFMSANLKCDVDAEMIISVDGTAATATPGTATPVGLHRTAALADVFTDSDVGAGTVVGSQNVTADKSGVFDLAGQSLDNGAATTQNLSLKTDVLTATCTLRIIWRAT